MTQFHKFCATDETCDIRFQFLRLLGKYCLFSTHNVIVSDSNNIAISTIMHWFQQCSCEMLHY